MLHQLTRAALCFTLGVGCMLAVAFACARWAPVELQHWGLRGNDVPNTAYAWYGNLGVDRIAQSRSDASWPEERTLSEMRLMRLPEWTSDADLLRTIDRVDHLTAGWPLRFVHAKCETTLSTGAPVQARSLWRSAIVMEQVDVAPSPRDRAFPFAVMWGPLLANTAIWSGGCWVLLLLLSLAHSALRRSRGRCPACGYDMRGETGRGCPECGWNHPAV